MDILNSLLEDLEDKWIIDYDDLEFEEEIGDGSFGKVFKGDLFGTPVAIKLLYNIDSEDTQKYVRREVMMLKDIAHPLVVQFMGICIHEEDLFIVTEWVPGGDLRNIMNADEESGGQGISWRRRIEVAKDVCISMNYLHKRAFIHRDVKPENLLIAESGRIKICDLGFTRKETSGYMTIAGSDDYMAPEVILGQKYDQSCDVFGFGVCLFEMIACREPPERGPATYFGYTKDMLKPYVPDHCPVMFSNLMYGCCEFDPSKRPTFAEALMILKELLKELPSTANIPPKQGLGIDTTTSSTTSPTSGGREVSSGGSESGSDTHPSSPTGDGGMDATTIGKSKQTNVKKKKKSGRSGGSPGGGGGGGSTGLNSAPGGQRRTTDIHIQQMYEQERLAAQARSKKAAPAPLPEGISHSKKKEDEDDNSLQSPTHHHSHKKKKKHKKRKKKRPHSSRDYHSSVSSSNKPHSSRGDHHHHHSYSTNKNEGDIGSTRVHNKKEHKGKKEKGVERIGSRKGSLDDSMIGSGDMRDGKNENLLPAKGTQSYKFTPKSARSRMGRKKEKRRQEKYHKEEKEALKAKLREMEQELRDMEERQSRKEHKKPSKGKKTGSGKSSSSSSRRKRRGNRMRAKTSGGAPSIEK